MAMPASPTSTRSGASPSLRGGTWEEFNDFGVTSDGDELALVERLLDHRAMPLLQFPYLEYDGRTTMRSLADALTKLRELGDLSDRENVEIKTAGIRLPDGRLRGIVSVLGPHRRDGIRSVIFMPSSATFSARTTLEDRQQYEIQKLNDATSDSEGNVQLANGQFLHHIDLIPAPAHYDFSWTEKKIVSAAIVFLQREGLPEHHCYRSVDEKLLPGLKFVDYAQVAKVQIKRLKPVVRFIMQLRLPDVTETFIRAALKRAGMQLPRSGAGR
jgi:hypothetical protein